MSDIRDAFDAAWNEADKAETLQRLDGLTKARPIAPIAQEAEDEAVDEIMAIVRRLVRERDEAQAALRVSERDREMLRASLASLQRRFVKA